jgi:hypothetical protein
MSGAIPPLPQYAFMAWCLVKKHKDNFTFTLPLRDLRTIHFEIFRSGLENILKTTY